MDASNRHHGMVNPTETPAWRELCALAERADLINLRRLFADNPERADQLTFTVGEFCVDVSKQLLSHDVMAALLDLANQTNLSEQLAAMQAGAAINTTEARPALHTALRSPLHESIIVNGRNVVDEVHSVRRRLSTLADDVRHGQRTGVTGQAFDTVINLGIGGSDLGPAMASQALAGYGHPRLTCRFVSNVDLADLADALSDANPATTLFIVSSKSFSTPETLANAEQARRWLQHHLGDEAVADHMVAISANRERATAFGIADENCFPVWDWVGGRFSLDSAIGLALMIAIGPEAFDQFLRGLRDVDEHLASEPIASNVPILLGLIALWNRCFLNHPTRAVLPYSHALRRFPAFLQQLEMESNGKQVRADGEPVTFPTAPVIWGEPGTNGQHSFHQFLHQGTSIVPCDLIVFARPSPNQSPELADGFDPHQLQLVANCLAQAEALAFGRSADDVAAAGIEPRLVAHRTFPGNRPSTVIFGTQLTPTSLGQLVALYEHQVVVQALIWGINPFDQWGVELGKTLATSIADDLASAEPPDPRRDPSTRNLMNRYRDWR